MENKGVGTIKGKFAQLQRIEHNEKITRDSHYDVWYNLELGLLLGLREQETINVMQYHLAMEGLKQQRADRTHKLKEDVP